MKKINWYFVFAFFCIALFYITFFWLIPYQISKNYFIRISIAIHIVSALLSCVAGYYLRLMGKAYMLYDKKKEENYESES